MNRYKRLYVLLGVLVVACAGAFAVSKYEEKKEQIKNSDEVVLEIASENVTGLSWEYEGNTLSFHKEDSWSYDDDEAFPVSEEKINELLENFQAFGVSFIIEEVEDYGQYGLDDPICTISIETEEETWEIQLGDYSTMDEERYVSIGDGNVYLVQEDPLDSFDAELKEVIQNDEFPSFSKASVEQLTFSGADDYLVTYQEDSTDTYCEDDVYFTERDGKNRPLDTSLVKSYLTTVSNLGLTDYVTYKVTEEELASYGLDEPDLSVEVQYTPEDDEDTEENEAVQQTFTLRVSRDPEEAAQAEEEASDSEEDAATSGSSSGSDEASDTEKEEITAYAQVGESPIVYRLTTDQYESLMAATYDDLRHQEVLSADFDAIQQIDISLEGTDYTLTLQEEDDENTWYYGEEEVEIGDFEDALTSLTADGFTEEDPQDKEEIRLTVHLDNENYPEISISLYRYDGSLCLAVVDGESVSLVPRSGVVDLIEAVNAIVL